MKQLTQLVMAGFVLIFSTLLNATTQGQCHGYYTKAATKPSLSRSTPFEQDIHTQVLWKLKHTNSQYNREGLQMMGYHLTQKQLASTKDLSAAQLAAVDRTQRFIERHWGTRSDIAFQLSVQLNRLDNLHHVKQRRQSRLNIQNLIEKIDHHFIRSNNFLAYSPDKVQANVPAGKYFITNPEINPEDNRELDQHVRMFVATENEHPFFEELLQNGRVLESKDKPVGQILRAIFHRYMEHNPNRAGNFLTAGIICQLVEKQAAIWGIPIREHAFKSNPRAYMLKELEDWVSTLSAEQESEIWSSPWIQRLFY